MGEEIGVWRVIDGELRKVDEDELAEEKLLEDWLEKDVSILSPDLLVIGRQVPTDFGGRVDLICLDSESRLVLLELKRGATKKDVVTQLLEYAAWASELDEEAIRGIASGYLKEPSHLDESFVGQFGGELRDLSGKRLLLYVVANRIDPSTQRALQFLSETHGVPIAAATFQFHKLDDLQLLCRNVVVRPAVTQTAKPDEPTVEQLLDAIPSAKYREAVRRITDDSKAAGFLVSRTKTGLTIALRVPDEPKPLTVAWFYPEGVAGTSWLKDLTLGFRVSPPQHSNEGTGQVLANFTEHAKGISGGERTIQTNFSAYTYDPETVIKQATELVACLKWLAQAAASMGEEVS